MGIFDRFKKLFRTDKEELEREALRREGIFVPSENAKKEIEESTREFQEIMGRDEAERKSIEREEKAGAIEEGLYPYPKVFLKEKKRFIRDAFKGYDLQCPKCGKIFNDSNEYWEHPCVTSDVHTKEFFRRAEKEAEKEKFTPLGSLLKDKSGTFPRREKEEMQKIGIVERIKNPFMKIDNFFKWVAGYSYEERHEKEIREEHLSKMLPIFNTKKITQAQQETLQKLSYGLSLELAKFWGIPISKILVPTVAIASEKEINEADIDIGEIAGQIRLSDSDIRFLEKSLDRKIIKPIIFKEEYLRGEFQSGTTNIKYSLAEEVCHSLEETVKEQKEITNDSFVSEFFGLISRLYISEQFQGLFSEKYREILREAREFTKEKTQLNDLIDKLDDAKLNLSETKRKKSGDLMVITLDALIRNTEIQISDMYSHLAYYPAAAYYFEIRNMTPQERSKLLKMEPEIIKKKIIEGKAEKLLQEILNTVQEREKLKERLKIETGKYPATKQFFEREEKLKEEIKKYPETASFFQKIAEGIGKREYGRESAQETVLETGEEYPQEEQEPEQLEQETSEPEEYPEEEYQETGEAQEEEQPEEAQEEQYAPESEQPLLPRINVNITDKIPKDTAKKLKSMGIKVPKDKIK